MCVYVQLSRRKYADAGKKREAGHWARPLGESALRTDYFTWSWLQTPKWSDDQRPFE
jgi:hypothetical protein